MNKTVKWAAELAHVREVSLFGTADLRFWTDWLAPEDLQPAECDGHAQIMIVAADAKYMGLAFQELSFSVLAQPQKQGAQPDGAFLVAAFNSRRFFAFCERVLFSTPYEYGGVTVSAAWPAAIELVKDRQIVFKAEMHAGDAGGDRQALRCGDHCWEGRVFLPRSHLRKGRSGKLFFARLRGFTKSYPFLPSADSLMIGPSPNSAVLRAIQHSHFVAKEWVIREDAVHAKSKTYTRA